MTVMLAIDLFDGGMAAFVDESSDLESAKRNLRIVETPGLPDPAQLPHLLSWAYRDNRYSEWLAGQSLAHDFVIVSLPNSALYRAKVYRALLSMGFSRMRFYSRAQMVAEGIATEFGKLVEEKSEAIEGFAVVQRAYPSNYDSLELSIFEYGDDVLEQLGTRYMPPSTQVEQAQEALRANFASNAAEIHNYSAIPVDHVFYAGDTNLKDIAFVCSEYNCTAIECLPAPYDVLPGLLHRISVLRGESEHFLLLNCLGFSIWAVGRNVNMEKSAVLRDDVIPTRQIFTAPAPKYLEGGKLELVVGNHFGVSRRTEERLYVPVTGNNALELMLDVDARGIPMLSSSGIPGGSYNILQHLGE